MSTKKSGGSSKNLRDSKPKFLGVKRSDGQTVKSGEIIVRQRGTKIEAGKGVKLGNDHTIFAVTSGVVNFRNKRKVCFNGKVVVKKAVDVLQVA
jgi:large subunit ribosomal protein L27